MLIDPEGFELSALMVHQPPVTGCHMVEIGCGDGRLTRRYCARVESVLAIDPDEALIAAFCASAVDPHVDVARCRWTASRCRTGRSTQCCSRGRCDDYPSRAWSMPCTVRVDG